MTLQEPEGDTAVRCHEHDACIRAFKRYATGELMPLAGWWHLRWDQESNAWHMTDPTGQTRIRDVSVEEDPVDALVGSVEGVAFRAIADTILKEGLFPPPPRDTP
jgi:hypothetical protein